MQSEGLPPCFETDTREPCPLDDIRQILERGGEVEEEEYRVAEGECSSCFWSSDEYTKLTTYGPLFEFALDYIRRRDLGLEQKNLTYREEAAVLVVHSEIERARSARMKQSTKQTGKPHG